MLDRPLISPLPNLNMRTFLLSLLMLSSCTFILNGGRFRAEDSQDFQFSAPGVKSVKIESYNGRIDLEEGSADQVLCTATFYATGKSQTEADTNLLEMKVVSSLSDEKLTISVPRHSTLGTNNVGARLKLKLPPGVEIEIYTSNGSIDFDAPFASPDLRTSNGNVDVIAASGPVKIHTGNGKVILSAHNSDKVRIKTSNGSIQYNGKADDFELVTSNGGVNLTLPDGWQGTGYVHSSNGNIRIDSAGTLNCALRATTSNGKVKAYGPRLPKQADTESLLTVETSNGKVTVDHGSQKADDPKD
jgi:DUF4097 and DUF4098 domain-containing protein YvlB